MIVKIVVKDPTLSVAAAFVTLKFSEDETVMDAMMKVANKLKLDFTTEELRQKFAFHIPGSPEYLQLQKPLKDYGFTSTNTKTPQLDIVQLSTRITLVGLDNDAKPTRIDFSKERELQSLLYMMAQEYGQKEKDLQFVIAKNPDKEVSLQKSLLDQGVSHDDVILVKCKKLKKRQSRVHKSLIQRKRKTSSLKRSKFAPQVLGVGNSLPRLIHDAISWIEVKAIQTPDIFLLSGKPADIEPVMKMYESGVEVDLDLSPDPFMVCGVLLESLRRLPGAIVPPAVMLEIQGLRDQGKFTAANVGGILSELPVPNILLLKHMIAFLCRVTYHADHNRMTAARLSTIFAPLIVHESGAPLNHQIEIVAALVTDPSLLQFAQKGNHQPKERVGTFMDGIAVSYATAIRDVASMVCAETIHLLIDPVTCHTPRHVSLVGKLFLTNFKLLFTTVSSGGASGVPADRVTPSSSPDLAEASGNTSASDSPSMPRKMGTGGRAQLTFSIELAKMHLVEKKSKDGGVQQLRITCKNGSHLSLSITNQTDFQQAWEHLKSFAAPQHLSRLFAFTYGLHDMSRIKDASRGKGTGVSEGEFTRQGVGIPTDWRFYTTKVGRGMPKDVLIPSSLWEDVLVRAANCYVDKRFPTLVWQQCNSKFSILVSGTRKGLSGAANPSASMGSSANLASWGSDQSLGSSRSSLLHTSNPDADRVVLMDSIRTVVGEDTVISTVVLTESRKKPLAANPNSNQSIHNFASARECYGKLIEAINAGDTSEMKMQATVKEWLGLVSDVLAAANSIAALIDSGASVVVEDDGEMFYPVLGTAMLLLDPFYRTIDGFQPLVEQVWTRFQFPFGRYTGVGTSTGFEATHIAPFILWVDCVCQIVSQFPTQFEYSETMLTYVLDALFSGQFGTFLSNSEREASLVARKTVTLWSDLAQQRSTFLSPLFDPSTIKNPSELSPSEQKEMILVPEVDTSHLSFWSVYFLSWVDRERCQASFWLVEESREKAEPVPVLDLSGQELSSLPPNVCGTPPPTADGELPSGTADSASPRVPSTTEEGSSVDDSSDDIPKPQQLVETSQKPLPGKLVLAQNKFRAFPLQILTLKHLQSLDLAGNAIQYLSGDMCKLLASLKQLTVLNLSNNQLTTVHENIGLLDGLYSLTLGGQGSKSRKLPDTLFSMEKLRSLDLHGFVIETLPESITKMVSLEFLSLVNNSLVDVASMANGSFPKLRAILLKENRIRTLPWAGLEVPQLHLLDISSNQLSGRLSDTLCHLDSTIELIVSDNQIESVPPAIVQLTSLRSLDLSRNNIKQLPPNIGFMTRLEQLDISENPVGKGTESQSSAALLADMREQLTSPVTPYRTRVMVVGQENVGKSTLSAALKKSLQSNPQNLSTDGIAMNDWHMKAQFEGESKQVNLQLWDFAGQEIYYCTHQLFLVDNAIYVLVCNIMDVEVARLEFWLHSIKARSNASIIVVGTHTDHERCTKDYLGQTLQDMAEKYSQTFPQVKTITAVSCLTGKGVTDLRTIIKELLPQQSFITTQVPCATLLLEQELLALRGTLTPPVISWARFLEIAALFRITEEQQLEETAKILHSWGTIVHHSDPNFNDIVVIDPKWLTEVLATIVTTKHRYVKDGVLCNNDLLHIWHSSDYPVEMHPALLRLIQKLEIVYQLNPASSSQGDSSQVDLDAWRKNFTLVPCLLPADRPKAVDNRFPRFEPGPQLCRLYHMEFVPVGLLNHLIVRVMQTSVSPTFWRNGIMAYSKDSEQTGNKILLEHVQGTTNLKVSVRGSNPTPVFLQLVDIVDSFIACWYRIEVDVTAPCPHCYREKSYDPHLFPMELCKDAAVRGDAYLDCSSGSSVRLDTIAPDLSMAQVTKLEYSELEMLGELGRGGFATVYKARFKGDIVAVKQLDIHREDGVDSGTVPKEAFDDFLKETWIMSGIQHQNIIGFRGLCMQPLCIVTDCAPGGNLYDFLHSEEEEVQKQASDWMLKLKIAFDIAAGMRFLHNRMPPLIHSDLKSPNILLMSTNPSDQVVAVVADFGLSTKWVPVLQGRKVDNPVWLAPEIIKGKEYTEKADVYAYGVILYEILTLKPFLSEYRFFSEMEDSIVAGKRPELPSDANPRLLGLIEDCWATDANVRPAFDEVLQRLTATIMEEEQFGRVNLSSFAMEATEASVEEGDGFRHLSVDLSGSYVVGETAFAFDFAPRHQAPISCMVVVGLEGSDRSGESTDTGGGGEGPKSHRRMASPTSPPLSPTSARGSLSPPPSQPQSSPASDALWAACDDGLVYVWEGSESERRDDYFREAVYPMHGSKVTAMLVTGELVWTSCPEEMVVKVWNARTRALTRVLRVRHEILCLHRVNDEVWGGTPDGIILFWPLVSRKKGSETLTAFGGGYVAHVSPTAEETEENEREFIAEVAKKMRDAIEGVPTSHTAVEKVVYPNSFSAGELLTWLTANYAEAAPTPAAAEAIAAKAFAAGFLYDVTGRADGFLADSDSFFRLSPSEASRCRGLVVKGATVVGVHLPTLYAEDGLHASVRSSSHSALEVQAIGCMHLDPSTGLLWLGTSRHLVALDVRHRTVTAVVQAHRQLVQDIVVTEEHVWSCSQDKTINICEKRGRQVKQIVGHTAAVVSLVEVEGEIWSASQDKSIIVWSSSSFEFIREIKGRHEEPIVKLLHHPRKRHVLSASLDRTICAWRTTSSSQASQAPQSGLTRRVSVTMRNTTLARKLAAKRLEGASDGLLGSAAAAAVRELWDEGSKANFLLLTLVDGSVAADDVRRVEMRHLHQEFSTASPAVGLISYAPEVAKAKGKGKGKGKGKAKKPLDRSPPDRAILLVLCNPENAPMNVRLQYSGLVDTLKTAICALLKVPTVHTVVVHNPGQLTETFVRFEYERSKGLEALHAKQKQLKADASASVVHLSSSSDGSGLRSSSPVPH